MKTIKTLLGLFTTTAALVMQAYAQSWLTNGLVAYYPFNGNANDQSGNGINGTAYIATLSTNIFGVPNTAYKFPGTYPTNSFIDLGRPPSLQFTNDFTVSAWVLFTGGDSNPRIVSYGQAQGYELLTEFTGASRRFSAYCGGSQQLLSGHYYTASNWFLVTLVRAGFNLQLYVNGVPDGSIVVNNTPVFNYNCVIGKIASSVDYWGGLIDEVRFYNRALSESEIKLMLTIEVGPPTITIQPIGQPNKLGTDVAMGVTAIGTAPLHYQWRKDGANIDTGTNTTLSLPNVQTKDAGNYDVVVTNTLGSVTSVVAVLVVAVPPTITQQPGNQTVVDGRAASFSVTASGSEPLSYQWYSSIQVNTNYDPLVAGVRKLSYPGLVLGSVVLQSADWWPIAKGTSTRGLPWGTVMAVRNYFAGRVVAYGHDGLLAIADTPDQKQLLLNAFHWLNRQDKTNVVFSTGHGESTSLGNLQNLLSQHGFGFSAVGAPLTSNGLASSSILIVDNAWQDLAENEIETVRQFVQNGGGLCVAGLGWSYLSYNPGKTMADYPIVKLAAPFEITWLNDYVSDPDNLHPVKTLLAGQTNASLTLSSVSQANAGYFGVRVTNQVGSVFSDYVSLTVQPGPPIILTQPSSRTNNYGTRATFTVGTGGTAPFSYQWRQGGTNLSDGGMITGATTATLTFSSVLQSASGLDVVITNAYGSVTSSVAALTVLDPAVNAQPVSQIGQLGGSVTISVTAAGTGPLSYQWRKDGVWIPWGINSSLALTNLQVSDAGNYDVVVCGAYGCVVSTVATLSINQAALDSSFSPSANSPVYSLAVQADGRILVGGGFTTLGGQGRNYIARLNANGTLDAYFNPSANNYVYSLALQADGTILAGGGFTTVGGQTCNRIGRLNANGTLDPSFSPNANSTVYSMAVQADGKILVGGAFTALGGQVRNRVARLNADGTLDPSFNLDANSTVYSLAVQADGRILVGGAFTALGGQVRNRVARLNADGTLDPSFSLNANNSVFSLAVQADGKILLGGAFTTLGGQTCNRIGRLNTDGTLDPSFTPNADSTVYSLAMQADGKILVGGAFSTLGGKMCNGIGRLNADGTLDPSFNPNANSTVYSVAVQADGRVLVGGGFSTLGGQPRSYIARLNNTSPATNALLYDGANITWLRGGTAPEVWRTTFEFSSDGTAWAMLGDGNRVPGGWAWSSVAVTNGTIRALGYATGGYFNGSGGIVETGLGAPGITAQPTGCTNNAATTAMFNVGVAGTTPLYYQWRKAGTNLTDGGNIAGALTSTLTVSNVFNSDAVAYDVIITNAYGSVTSGMAFLTVIEPSIQVQPVNQIGQLGGSVTFSITAAATGALSYQWRKDGLGLPGANSRSLLLTNLQAGATGAYDVVVCASSVCVTSLIATLSVNQALLDTSFNPNANNSVNSLMVQADGKILVGGGFTTLGGQARNAIARLNGDGTLDAYFNPSANFFINVYSLALQADAKILVGGTFVMLAGQERNRIARLNADGTLDANFNPSANELVASLAVQADGKILVGGIFTTLGGQGRNRIARLNTDGTLDSTFDPGANDWVTSLAVQADGKILVGGLFSTLGGQERRGIARLNADGTLDSGFNPNASSWVETLVVQADGKILVGGNFTVLSGQGRNRIARLNADGSLDTSFNPDANSDVLSLAVQADGKILVGGQFTTMGGQICNRVGRLNADGTLDVSFNPNANSAVRALTLQPDGKILLGGGFTTLGGQARNYIARLNNTSPATSTLAYDGTNITWLRGGTAPEVWRTTIEYSADGIAWAMLGNGTRVPGGWALRGVAVTNGTLRALGYAVGGYYCASGGIVEAGIGTPSITIQPTGRTNNAGTMATLSVSCVGTTPLNYQWYALMANQTGASATALTFGGFVYDAVLLSSGSGYTRSPGVRILGGGGNGAAAVAVLSNGVVTAINMLDAGFGYTSVPTIVIDPPDGYLPGATNAVLSVSNLAPTDAGNYFVVITNNQGSATSRVAVLTVRLAPIILAQPQNKSPLYGKPASFTVSADGGIPLKYQWLLNGTVVAGATNAALAIASATASVAGGYAVLVSNSYGSVTSIVATLTVQMPPVVLTQPQNQWPLYGAPARFSVTADGASPLRYQWFRDGWPVNAATNQSLFVAPATDSVAGGYSVVITNSYGSVTSSVATLTVQLTPAILTQPKANTTVLKGGNTSLGVIANGATPLDYQWFKNGAATAGATNSALSLQGVTANDSGNYTVVLANRYGSVTSSVAVVTVVFQPEIIQQPSSTTVTTGSTAQFSAQVAGTEPLRYRWFNNGAVLPGATQATLIITNVQPPRIGNYQVVITNAYGSVTSSVASLSISNVSSSLWQGLMAYYPFNGNAVDATGHGNDGIPYGVVNAVDRFGNADSAFAFNGTNAYIWIGTNVRPCPITASVWFETSATTSLVGDAQLKLFRDRWAGWDLQINLPDGYIVGSARANNEGFLTTAAGYNDGRWHMAALTYDGYTSAIYVDGVLQQQQTQTNYVGIAYFYDGSSGLAMGRDGDYPGAYFRGSIDDAAIYNRALSASEVQQLYAFEFGPSAPIITSQPVSQSVYLGSPVSFSVSASGAGLNFQWRLDSTNISGATNATYSLACATTNDAGNYAVIVSNAGGSVTSSNAVLTVIPPPRTATGTATLFGIFVVAVNITDGGSGYTHTPLVRLIGGGGTGAQAVAVVSNGVIAAINMLNAGYGYTKAPMVVIEPPFIPNPVLGIAPMSFLAFSNLTTGVTYQLQRLVGWNWTDEPVSFTASNLVYTQMVAGVAGSEEYRLAQTPVPTQAAATAQVINGFVVAATVTSGGSGYVTNPAVSLVGGGGANATAVAHLSGDAVSGISITSAGFGYTSTPTIQIAAPPIVAVSPTVLPVMRVDAGSLAPYNNYQIQFKPDLGEAWGNWNGGLFTPTDGMNSQYLFITNGAGFFRLQHEP